MYTLLTVLIQFVTIMIKRKFCLGRGLAAWTSVSATGPFLGKTIKNDPYVMSTCLKRREKYHKNRYFVVKSFGIALFSVAKF